MERRNVLAGFAATALAGIASAATEAAHDHHQHHQHHGHGKANYGSLARSAADCLTTGEACMAHCHVLLGEGDKAMAACAQSVNQLLAVCSALQKLAAQQSSYVKSMARLALDVCQECEKECRKHEKKHQECAACADACASCVKECKALSA